MQHSADDAGGYIILAPSRFLPQKMSRGRAVVQEVRVLLSIDLCALKRPLPMGKPSAKKTGDAS